MDDPDHAGGVTAGGGEEANVLLTADGLRTIWAVVVAKRRPAPMR
jgi:hypothetical protein